MGSRRAGCAGAVLLAGASVAGASDHRFAAFVAPSYLHAKGSSLDLGGWHVSGEATIEIRNSRRFGLGADLSMHFIGEDSGDGRGGPAQYTLMVGPRFTVVGVAEEKGRHPPVQLFVQAMVLGAVIRTGVDDAGNALSDGALTVGAGIDFTPKGDRWGIRAQADYIWPASGGLGHSWRYSLGLLRRFPEHE